MARSKGTLSLASNIEPSMNAPLDGRTVVNLLSDLTASGSYPYYYEGMIVSCKENHKVYQLVGNDPTVADNWSEVGTGGGANIFTFEIYLDSNDEYVTDTLPSEVAEALSNNDIIRLRDDYGEIYWLNSADEDGWTYHFSAISIYSNPYELRWHTFTSITLDKSAGSDTWESIVKQTVSGDTLSGKVLVLPIADQSLENVILQYIGATDANYTNGYFYKCIEDSTTPGTYKWEAIQVQAGGSGGGSLGKAITAAVDVGGIDAGDSFTIGTSYDDMWDALLNPTLYPSFTAPSASLTYSADTYYEVKSTIPAKTATESLNRGSISPAYGTSGYRSGAATGYALASSGADTEYSDSNTTGTFSVSALTRSTKGNIVLTATVSYAAGEQPKDSKGNNYDSPLAAGSKTASKTMQFIQAYFYGKSSTPTISSFSGLSKSVTAKGEKKFSYTTNNEYMVIAYDSSYGNLKTILDPNSFDVTSGWTKSTLTVDGFTYYVYIANSPTTDTNAQFTFKY